MGQGTSDIIRIFRPLIVPVLIVMGGLGTFFAFIVDNGGILIGSLSLILLFTGLGLYGLDRAERKAPKEDKSTKSSKTKRKKGKRCPSCRRMISSERTECQHCGFKFHTFVEGAEP